MKFCVFSLVIYIFWDNTVRPLKIVSLLPNLNHYSWSFDLAACCAGYSFQQVLKRLLFSHVYSVKENTHASFFTTHLERQSPINDYQNQFTAFKLITTLRISRLLLVFGDKLMEKRFLFPSRWHINLLWLWMERPNWCYVSIIIRHQWWFGENWLLLGMSGSLL